MRKWNKTIHTQNIWYINCVCIVNKVKSYYLIVFFILASQYALPLSHVDVVSRLFFLIIRTYNDNDKYIYLVLVKSSLLAS